MMQGILIVDKPMDWTSFDVVAKLRGVLGTRKLGHSGTLDPMATGVLPVFCGGASKAVDLQLNHDKTYRATLRLGARTDTGDSTGTVLETAPVTAGEKELLAVLPQFIPTLKRYRASVQHSRNWIVWITPVSTLCLLNIKVSRLLSILRQARRWESLWKSRCFITATTWFP